MSASPYRIVRDFEPLRLEIQHSALTDASLRAHMEVQKADMEEAAEAGRKGVMLLDIRRAPAPSRSQRAIQGEWIAANTQLLRDSTLAMGFVATPFLRPILKGILWANPLPVPHEVFAGLDAAVRWGSDLLVKAGTPPPDAVLQRGATAFDGL